MIAERWIGEVGRLGIRVVIAKVPVRLYECVGNCERKNLKRE